MSPGERSFPEIEFSYDGMVSHLEVFDLILLGGDGLIRLSTRSSPTTY